MCSELLRQGWELVLIGRDESALREVSADLKVQHHRECPIFLWKLLERDSHARRFADLIRAYELDGLFFAPGILFTESEMLAEPAKAKLLLDVNLTEPIAVVNLFAKHFRDKDAGIISVLSSVAGDRGRARNRTYGASKAGLTTFLEGLRMSLPLSVLIQIVKPGPVDTPMLAGYRGPGFMLASPDSVARDIVKAIRCRRKEVYTPGYWRWIMASVRVIPDFLLRRITV